ncbi:MAG: transcription termination factor Rho [Clostridiales bacterium]|nr:transcription termination factor Rho [Clostridiales bacterium]
MSEKYENMSVVELRKAAKEMGVRLGAGINKQGIIEKLLAAEPEQMQPAAPETPHRPIRTAAIITDDEGEDDPPVLTPNPQPVRLSPARPAVQGASSGASSLSTISAKAPAFTMEGSRAWNNPRPYQSTAPGYQRNQNWSNPRSGQSAGGQRAYGGARPQQPPRPAPAYTPRFGPEQTPQEAEKPAADYRPAPLGAQAQDYQPAEGYQGQAGGYPQQGGYSQQGFGSQQPAYTRPAASHYPPAPAPGPTLPELLSAGDVGDGEGVLEMHPDGYGILRSPDSGKKDIYISAAQIRRFALRTGDRIAGKTRPQRDTDRYTAMLYITDINGHAADEVKARPAFDSFTPIYPKKRINLSGRSQDAALRLIDLMSPIGFGQRAVIACGAKSDPEELLKKLAAAVCRNYPKAHVKVLLVNENPEEVTALREALRADVAATTFDQSPEDQIKVFDLTCEQAQRLVEDGQDAVILVNSLTKMARICNQAVPASARTLAAGLAAGAMLRPKRLLGAARNTREAGTLTVIAFAAGETAFDAAVLEEIKGTANMELTLNGAAAVGFDPLAASTKKSELLLTEPEQHVAGKIRDMLRDLPPEEASAQLLSMLEKTENNDDLVQKFDGWMSL